MSSFQDSRYKWISSIIIPKGIYSNKNTVFTMFQIFSHLAFVKKQISDILCCELHLHCLSQPMNILNHLLVRGAQWLSGRVLNSRPKGRRFEPHRRHFVVSLSKNISPSLVLVQPRKTRPFITERLLMGRKESNQTNKQTIYWSATSPLFKSTNKYLKSFKERQVQIQLHNK